MDTYTQILIRDALRRLRISHPGSEAEALRVVCAYLTAACNRSFGELSIQLERAHDVGTVALAGAARLTDQRRHAEAATLLAAAVAEVVMDLEPLVAVGV